MRLLKFDKDGTISRSEDLVNNIPVYAILSHTHGDDEITFDDFNAAGLLKSELLRNKAGYAKIQFCGEQATKDGLEYFWVDTCCINKLNTTERSVAINSMFSWYRNAEKCYVYLSDVSASKDEEGNLNAAWELAFRTSRWFTRGWTLQELLAPTSVQFFSYEREFLGDKTTLEQQIHKITGIPTSALRSKPLSQFSIEERMSWATNRYTARKEDQAYCLLGILNLSMSANYGEHEQALVRLRNEVERSLTKQGKTHWLVPRSPNDLFIGRKDILDHLERVIYDAVQPASIEFQPPKQSCIVIIGMGGQGKSELSLQLAHRVRSSFCIFWVDGSTVSVLENGFLDIACELQGPILKWKDGLRGLADLEQPWLLIMDNADDPNIDYRAYFPQTSFGTVIMISRYPEHQRYATACLVELEALPISEATELLLRAAGVTDEQRPFQRDDARRAALKLESHPLALLQAGAYIWRTGCSISSWSSNYERELSQIAASTKHQALDLVLKLCVDSLQNTRAESSQDALELLLLLAMCSPDQVPLSLFEAAWKGSRRLTATASVDKDNLRLTNWDRILHEWTRDWQDLQRQRESWIAMGCIVALSDRRHDLWLTQAWQLEAHLQALTSWNMEVMFGRNQAAVIAILVECGLLMHKMRTGEALSSMLDRLSSHMGLDKHNVDPRWLRLYMLVACSALDCGKTLFGVGLLEEVVQVQRELLEEGHPDLLASQHELAVAYITTERLDDGIMLLQDICHFQRSNLAEDYPDRLASQSQLAKAYMLKRELKKAVPLMQQAIKAQDQSALDEQAIEHHENLIEDDQSDGNLTDISLEPPSLATDLTIYSMGDEYEQVVEHLVEIFCSDENIGPTYRKAVRKLGIRNFSRYHDRLLKLYFRALRHEVKSRIELATTRLLRTRRYRSEITSLILTSLKLSEDDQGQLTSIILADRKTERNYSLDKFLRNLNMNSFDDTADIPPRGIDISEGLGSESDESSSESEDESPRDMRSPLQAIDNFLTGGRAFDQLTINLASLLRPPLTLEDALESESEFVVKQSIARIIEGQPSKDQETILRLRKQDLSITAIAKVLLKTIPASSLRITGRDQEATKVEQIMTADSDTLKCDTAFAHETGLISETEISESKGDNPTKYQVLQVHMEPQLVTWTCSCGAQLSDYYTELVPGSLEQLQDRLRKEHSNPPSFPNYLWNDLFSRTTSRSPAKGTNGKDHDQCPSAESSAQTTQSRKLTNPSMMRNADADTQSGTREPCTSSRIPINITSNHRESFVSYLLLCFPEGLSGVKLCQQQILNTAPQQDLPNRVTNDKQLFQLLRKTYASEHRSFMYRFWPKTVIRVSLAYFLVDHSEYVELKHYACHTGGDNCRCIPPPEIIKPSNNAQYDCIPREPVVKPPIGPNYLTHYFQNPHCIKTERLVCTLNQIPKRVGPCMAISGTERVEGWGLEFEEGWDRGRLRHFVFGLMIIGILIFAILCSVLKKDIQSAFGISGFVVGILAIISGYIASAEPRIVHK